MRKNSFFVLCLFFIICFSLLVSGKSYTPLISNSLQVLEDNDFIVNQSQYIIYNPYESIDFSQISHYKTNLHTHSTESDGDNSVEEVILHYALTGSYHILAITDHNKNVWPWSNWLTGYTADYITNSSAYYSHLGQGLLAISGNEPSNSHHHGSLLNNYNGNGAHLHESFTEIENKDGVSLFYHPGRYTNPNSKYYETNWTVQWYNDFFDFYYDSLLGIEVYNCGNRYGPAPGYLGDVIWWDSVNALRDADDLVWGFSNDDLHNISFHAFRNYQHFLMNELNEEELRITMQKGAFYFSYEPFGSFNLSVFFSVMHQQTYNYRNDFLFTTTMNILHHLYLNQFLPRINDVELTALLGSYTIFSEIFEKNSSDITRYGQAKTPKLTYVDIYDSLITIQTTPSALILWFDNQSRIVGTGLSIDVSSIQSNFVRAVAINVFGRTYTQPFGIKKNTV
jgi:hypothetical protein